MPFPPLDMREVKHGKMRSLPETLRCSIGGEVDALNLGPALGPCLVLLSIFPQFVQFLYCLWFSKGPTVSSPVIFVIRQVWSPRQFSVFLSQVTPHAWLLDSLTHVSPSPSQRELADVSESPQCLCLSASDQGLCDAWEIADVRADFAKRDTHPRDTIQDEACWVSSEEP